MISDESFINILLVTGTVTCSNYSAALEMRSASSQCIPIPVGVFSFVYKSFAALANEKCVLYWERCYTDFM